jgi:WD40 repeat protein
MPDSTGLEALFVRRYFDRHIMTRLAVDLRGRGYDVLTTEEAGFTALAASPDGTLLATGYADGTVSLWNPATTIERFALRGHQDEVYALTFTGGGRTLVSATAAEVIRWDAGSGARQKTVALTVGPIEQAVLTPDRRMLPAVTPADQVFLVDSATGSERARLERPARRTLSAPQPPEACHLRGGGAGLEPRTPAEPPPTWKVVLHNRQGTRLMRLRSSGETGRAGNRKTAGRSV